MNNYIVNENLDNNEDLGDNSDNCVYIICGCLMLFAFGFASLLYYTS
jgi:hypothetical protein